MSSRDEPGGDLVLIEHDGSVVTLTLNDPQRGNALTDGMLATLRCALDQLRAESGVRAVILTGAGSAFCLGADIGDLAAGVTELGESEPAGGEAVRVWYERLNRLASVVRRIRGLPCPVLAALNGQAAGAGLSLALACDYRMALPQVGLNIAYGRLGAGTDSGMSWFLPRIVGHARAMELLLEQPVIRAAKAVELGLVNAIAEPGELIAAVRAKAKDFAAFAPQAVAASKRLVDESFFTSLDAHIEREHETFLRVLRTADVRRGVAAAQAGEWALFEGD
ncbi:enoyl-CoA hydratase/isomerase family protein [Streptomyces sp. NPDC003328]